MHGVSLLVVIAVLACAACNGSDSEQAGEVPPPPEVGQCRITPDSNLDDAVDDTPVVDCSQTHTLQTLNVIESDEKITVELLEQLAKYCDSEAVGAYVDSPGRGAYNLAWPIVYGPTPEQAEAGQSWVRCDAGIQSNTHCCSPLVPQTESLEGAMGKNLARFQHCIAEVPDADRSQPLTSCEKPHRAELLITILDLDASEYPSAAKLEKTGQTMCSDLVADRDDADALVLMPFWLSEEESQGGTIHGGCWIRYKSGLLPAL
jgi:hypothetical protein